MLSRTSPFILGVYNFTSAHLAKVPSTPSTNKANAKNIKTNVILPLTAEFRARKLKKTPETVNR